MYKVLSVVLIAYLALVVADSVKFKDCGSVESKIQTVDITPCPQEPCIFQKGSSVNVSVTFTSNVAIQNATTKVYGIIAGAKISFPQPPYACQNMTCPVPASKTVSYKNSVNVLKIYPSLSLVVQWEVVDTNGKMVFCFDVPVQIKS